MFAKPPVLAPLALNLESIIWLRWAGLVYAFSAHETVGDETNPGEAASN